MTPHRALTLASSVAGAMIVALDGTVLTVVQPTLQRELGASFAQVQWTSTGYLVAVAGLLVFAGRLGDRYGHQRVFGVGMLGFGAASAGIGVAPGIGWVIALRVAQGVFGALLQPATLGMLRAAFPPDRLRMPIALRMSAIGVAAAAGPVLGGALVSGPGWRAVFLLNVAPAAAFGTLALAVRVGTERRWAGRPDIATQQPRTGRPDTSAQQPLPSRPDTAAEQPRTARFDTAAEQPHAAGPEARLKTLGSATGQPPSHRTDAADTTAERPLPTTDTAGQPPVTAHSTTGQPPATTHPTTGQPPAKAHPTTRLNALSATLLALSLAALVHALVTLPSDGLSPTGWAALLIAPVAGAGFVRHERRTPWPLLPSDVVRSPAVAASLGILVAASATLQGTLFVATFLLQDTLGFDPLHMALLGLPLAALVIAAAPGAAVLLRRAGARRTTVGAMAVLAAGVLVLVRASGSPALCAGFALLGAGYGTVMVAATHVVVRQAPVESAGVAGGLQQTAMNVGPVLGVAVATTLMGLGHGHALPLLVLAALAGAAAAVAGPRLPKRSPQAINTGQEGDPARVPARR
ncbi:MFS transporter [Streptomyces cylindrosporus]|uniref:MFS transporter n=1 Tax=Streptomyces cylindrosporus TaxID=2927583 RepID=A0ABS9Y180_9ACTN|nr:MFS transporter [Streptomyces cylindrosporus]MCI3270983.1 MFS transporter [Streptomyces cylindrosporus]